jgi:hypothetical protein
MDGMTAAQLRNDSGIGLIDVVSSQKKAQPIVKLYHIYTIIFLGKDD